MAKPNRFFQTKSFNKLEKSDKILNTCSKTVRDGIHARKALKMFRLHQSQKKVVGTTKSATTALNIDKEIKKNTSGNVQKAIQDKVAVSIRNRNFQAFKSVKNEEEKYRNQNILTQYAVGCNSKQKETKLKILKYNFGEEKKYQQQPKEKSVIKSKLGRKVKFIGEMSGDTTSTVGEAMKQIPPPRSGFKLIKVKKSQDIPNEVTTTIPKAFLVNRGGNKSSLQTNVKKALQKLKLIKSASYTSVCVSTGLTDLTQGVPSEEHHQQLQVARPSSSQVLSETDITETLGSDEKKQFEFQNTIAFKIPQEILLSPPEPATTKIILDTTPPSKTSADLITISPSATAKACIKYNRMAQQALSNLNNEVSAALRDSFCSIDDIKFRVFNTVEKINEADKLYQKLKTQKQQQQQLATQSTPQLTKSQHNNNNNNIIETPNCSELLRALTFGLVQTQSENQLRLAVMTPKTPSSSRLQDVDNNESETITTCMHEIDDSPLTMPPLEYPVVKVEAKQALLKETILPKIVPIVEAIDHPCTALKQQKIDFFNIPPCMVEFVEQPIRKRIRNSASKEKVLHNNMMRRQPLTTFGCFKRPPPSPLSKICKFTHRDLSPEIKLRLKEIAVRLGLDDLPRSRAQPDLYHKLIKEFVATDSLIEFQRQMKHVNNNNNKKNECEEIKEEEITIAAKIMGNKNETKNKRNNKVVEIIAEELYVPDRKINKIVATDLNNSAAIKNNNKTSSRLNKPKCCQFLYREKKKKRNYLHLKKIKKELDKNVSNTILLSTKFSKTKHLQEEKRRKYADSLWFCSHNKKELFKNGVEKPLKQAISVTKSDTVIMCDSTKSVSTFDMVAQTQTDDLPRPPQNLQAMTCKSGLDCFDILDEITLKDLKPLESEYPRKDHIGSEPYYKQAENTYLYKLVYGSQMDEFLQLLSIQEPSLQCSTAGCQTCLEKISQTSQEKNRKVVNEECKKSDWYPGKTIDNKKKPPPFILPTTNSKNNNKQQKKRSVSLNDRKDIDFKKQLSSGNKIKVKKTKKNHQDVATRLLPYMFDPKMRYPTTITVMPVTVTTYTNPNFAHRTKSSKNQGGDFTTMAAQNFEKQESNINTKPATTKKKQPTTTMGNDRKLWETKYAKSPSNNLISYLEKQNSDSPKQMLGEICNQNFVPNPKNNFITPMGGKKNSQLFQSQTLRTHSQPHYAVKNANVKNFDKTQHAKVAVSKIPRQQKQYQHQQQKEKKDVTVAAETSAKKQTLEKDIQNVIEMIEGKIIDLVSSPEKLHSEAFNNVEKEIVDILRAMQTEEEIKPLASISEDGSSRKETRKPIKKSTIHSKTSIELDKHTKSITNNSLKLRGLLTSEIIMPHTTELEHKSSTEGTFEITSSCEPVHNSPRKKIREIIPQEVAETIEKIVPVMNNNNNNNKEELPKKIETEPKIKELEQAIPKLVNVHNKDAKMISTVLKSPKIQEQIKITPSVNNYQTVTAETSLIPLETEIKSDQFLTPFMHALKQYREEEHKNSYNILEFLDTLTNISEDPANNKIVPPKTIIGCRLTTIHYKHKIHVANLLHEPETFYPIFIWEPITMFPPGTKVLYKSETITSELKHAQSLFSSLNLSQIIGYGGKNVQQQLCSAKEIFPICLHEEEEQQQQQQRSSLRAICCSTTTTNRSEFKPLIQKYSDEHGKFLNTVYGMLFTVVFLSLSFNYTC